MKIERPGETVTTADGVTWTVRRRWVTRQLPRLRRVRGDAGGDIAAQSGGWLPTNLGGLDDLEAWLLAIVALVVIVFVLIPVLLFGIELIILGVVIASGLIGRLFLGRPWAIEARCSDGQKRVWEVSGWRQSRRALAEAAHVKAG